MKYSYSCPLCKESVTVEAESEDGALDEILAQGMEHAKKAHPDIPIAEPMLRMMVKKGMKKLEE